MYPHHALSLATSRSNFEKRVSCFSERQSKNLTRRSRNSCRSRVKEGILAEYRVYFRGSNGAIEARQGFVAGNDAEAIECAALVFEACSDECAGYELWSGTRLVIEFRERISPPRFDTLSSESQQRVVDFEERLQRSHWVIGKSQKLLRSIEIARKGEFTITDTIKPTGKSGDDGGPGADRD